MGDWLASRWINAVAGLVGGCLLGFGLGRFANGLRFGRGVSLPDAVLALLGAILLWWALSERRKADPDDPESELDGSHTIE
jgi:high-affinity Fe2+/Pb2+ permease